MSEQLQQKSIAWILVHLILNTAILAQVGSGLLMLLLGFISPEITLKIMFIPWAYSLIWLIVAVGGFLIGLQYVEKKTIIPPEKIKKISILFAVIPIIIGAIISAGLSFFLLSRQDLPIDSAEILGSAKFLINNFAIWGLMGFICFYILRRKLKH